MTDNPKPRISMRGAEDRDNGEVRAIFFDFGGVVARRMQLTSNPKRR